MSKRTAATRSGRPRQRTLIPRLSDVRIQSKLGLILLVPVLAVVALAGIELATAGQTLVDTRRVDATIKLSNQAGTLIQELQNERLSAAQVLLADNRTARTSLTDDFKRQNGVTDQQIAAYKAQRANVTDPPADMADELGLIDNQLDSLSKNGRLEVLSPSDATVASVTFRYQVLISELLDLRQSVVKMTGDRPLSDELSANAALSQAKEYAAQEQLSLLRVIADKQGFDNTSFESFLGTLTGQQSAYDAFNRTATEDQQQLLQDEVNGPHVQDSTALETEARTDGLGNSLSITATSWNKAMSERITAIRGVERDLDAQASAHAQDQVASVVRKVIAESAAGLLVLLVAIVLALLVARAMARSLRRLREGALRVAYEGLPQAVAQLETADSIGGMSPDEIANQVGDPIAVQGRDEIGQVSEAFNVVHREAVKTAAGQAVLRASVSTMFVNLARRSQLLVDRLIGHLDRLEQGEEDPDRLAQLFQLDHLATRMRRNDENLLVLAGADSTRARREAAPLGDVLRAAQSEVEQYTRIEFGVVDRDVEVEATAVNDVVHLIAELLDNATAFSSPDTAVVVDARRVGDRAIVQIEDRGIGMSADVLAEVNERLANPPLVDVAVSRMMGLVVVGRLASRLGIKIELRPAAERGTIADVTLPATVLAALDRPAQQRPATGLPAQAAPLALETGPTAPVPPAPEPAADPMPGVPFQPAARDTIADAANGHRHTNGMSALPRRSPAPPPGDEPKPAAEPTRRSLFDPVPRKPSEDDDAQGDWSATPPAQNADRTDSWALPATDSRNNAWATPADADESWPAQLAGGKDETWPPKRTDDRADTRPVPPADDRPAVPPADDRTDQRPADDRTDSWQADSARQSATDRWSAKPAERQ
ncbi:sensor histidine kinase, partial [Actinocatenispora rupis]